MRSIELGTQGPALSLLPLGSGVRRYATPRNDEGRFRSLRSPSTSEHHAVEALAVHRQDLDACAVEVGHAAQVHRHHLAMTLSAHAAGGIVSNRGSPSPTLSQLAL